MDPKSVLLGLREKSVGLSKAQTRIPWREIINPDRSYELQIHAGSVRVGSGIKRVNSHVAKCGIPVPDSRYPSAGLPVSVPSEQGYI